jgi:hypothetical protein
MSGDSTKEEVNAKAVLLLVETVYQRLPLDFSSTTAQTDEG